MSHTQEQGPRVIRAATTHDEILRQYEAHLMLPDVLERLRDAGRDHERNLIEIGWSVEAIIRRLDIEADADADAEEATDVSDRCARIMALAEEIVEDPTVSDHGRDCAGHVSILAGFVLYDLGLGPYPLAH
jgi:hypothetical protein